ncbi:MAG: hypothetical protein QOC99_2537 [Acidobacteriota bacterium]|jgi:hypothetical protein|nr:hypothetical protein [Acidobacteriota bacterium]MDT7780025.1 hypothetical protein [Acidobacteriota bacterium]
MTTTTTNKILPVALVAALLGGTVGAFVMRSGNSTPDAAQSAKTNLVAGETATAANDQTTANDQTDALDNEIAAATKNMSAEEKAAYRDGFMEGIQSERGSEVSSTRATRSSVAPSAERVVYRNNTRTRYVGRSSAPRRVYYDYGQRNGRSFWQKHRDKLTLAMGTGGGALLGGLIGGKRGAGIGALAGGGGSALYTYKLRKRHRNY